MLDWGLKHQERLDVSNPRLIIRQSSVDINTNKNVKPYKCYSSWSFAQTLRVLSLFCAYFVFRNTNVVLISKTPINYHSIQNDIKLYINHDLEKKWGSKKMLFDLHGTSITEALLLKSSLRLKKFKTWQKFRTQYSFTFPSWSLHSNKE